MEPGDGVRKVEPIEGPASGGPSILAEGIPYESMRLHVVLPTLMVCCIGQVSGSSIQQLIQESDAVVVGRATNRVEQLAAVTFDIAVERTVLGTSVPLAISVDHRWTGRRGGLILGGNESAQTGEVRGVWFLKRVAVGWDALCLMPPDISFYSLFYPAADKSPAIQRGRARLSPEDSVVAELFAGIRESGDDIDILIPSLSDVASPAVDDWLAILVASPNARLRLAGLAGQIQRSDPESLRTILSMQPGSLADVDLARISKALKDSYRSIAPVATAFLVELAGRSGQRGLRSAAVSALAATHTREALPFLASLLSTDDPEERMKGVLGISAFANGSVPQTPANMKSLAFLQLPANAPYQTPETIANFGFSRRVPDEEARLTAYWLSWWTHHPELHTITAP
jgi:hypothetical protein